jgi:hypothetical protein
MKGKIGYIFLHRITETADLYDLMIVNNSYIWFPLSFVSMLVLRFPPITVTARSKA